MKKLIIMLASLLLGSAGLAAEENQTTETTVKVEKSNSHAGGVFVEPYLTYESENLKTNSAVFSTINRDNQSNDNGFGIGARLGFHIEDVVFLAVDGRYAQPRMDNSIYNKTSADQYSYGATAGVQTPYAGLRIWGTYVLGGKLDPDVGSNGLDLQYDDLKGYRVGAGLYIKAISANLEYSKLTYGTTRVQSWGSVNIDSSFAASADLEGYTLALGFPFTL